ncbi:hypothetical protein [Streptomyces sp. NPDC017520]|uniref:hypothetical protein n=1 Tax=Streptomyces sp. NPDC017520 TaxID=3364998 RepID=UPI0037A9F04B
MRPVPASAAADSFVTRCGIRFCLDGEEYYFAGANAYGSGSGDTETEYMDKARIDAHFARMRNDGVDVVRLWMFSHEDWHGFEKAEGCTTSSSSPSSTTSSSQPEPTGCGSCRCSRTTGRHTAVSTPASDGRACPADSRLAPPLRQEAVPGCFTSYKNYVSYALNRTNHYSGVKYKDDPTIFAWDLMNEPRYEAQSPEEDIEGTTLRAWVDEMGAFMKKIDPNHLLGAGIEGHGTQYGFGGDEGNPSSTFSSRRIWTSPQRIHTRPSTGRT